MAILTHRCFNAAVFDTVNGGTRMLALVNSSTRVRPVCLPVQPYFPIAASQGVCFGAPSCSPLVQYELLKAMRERMPQVYTSAWCELDLTVSRTRELIDRRVEIISAARAIKLARMIAYEPNAIEVFGEAGRNLFEEMHRRFPRAVKATIRGLPRPARLRLALAWTQNVAHQFAGSVNQIVAKKQNGVISLSVQHGVFSDRPDTLDGAHEYYRRVFETMLRELAHVDCELTEVRWPRAHLGQCDYKIVWET
jgi:hypothetical protein